MSEYMRRVVVDSPEAGVEGFEGWLHKWIVVSGALNGIVERDDGQVFPVKLSLIRFKDSPAERPAENPETRNERICRIRNER